MDMIDRMNPDTFIDTRPDWDEYGMGIANAVSLRSDCRRALVGAVILDARHRVIGTGYPGVAPGKPGCLAGACPRGMLGYGEVPQGSDYEHGPGRCISTHAEMNALLDVSDRSRIPGSTMYVTVRPCSNCTKIIRNFGLIRIVYLDADEQLTEMAE